MLSRPVRPHAVFVLFAVSLAAACAPATPAPSSSATAAPGADSPKSGGTYQYVETAEPTIWDPHLSEARAVQDQGIIYPRLLQYRTGPGVDPNSFTVAPDLAQSWEQPDPTTYVFHLHQNAKWGREAPMNNRPIVADDVVFSFNRLASTISAFRTNFEAIERVEALDAYTVKFTLKYPFAPFLTYVAYHGSRVLPADLVQQCGDLRKVECAKKAGGGPWLLDAYQPGVQLVYVKNPDYYDAPKPYFDRIVAPIITNSSVALSAFTAHKIYSGVSMDATQAQSLKAQIPELQWTQEGTAQQSITFNVSRAPWDNLKVRQAISMALNRQNFIDTALLGTGRLEAPSRVWFSFAAPSDDELRAANNENVDAARALLAEAGYPNGFDGGQLLVAPGSGGDEQPSWIVDQLQRNLNIKLTLDHPEYSIGYDRFQKSDFGISYGVYARSYSDPDDYLYARYHTGAARNYSNCSDSTLDSMLEQQRTVADPDQRNALIKQIDTYFMTSVVCSITMPSTTDWFPWWPNVKNFTPHISFGGGDLTGAWLDPPSS